VILHTKQHLQKFTVKMLPNSRKSVFAEIFMPHFDSLFVGIVEEVAITHSLGVGFEDMRRSWVMK